MVSDHTENWDINTKPAQVGEHEAGGQEEVGPLTPDSGYGEAESNTGLNVRTEQNKIKKSTSLQFPRWGWRGGERERGGGADKIVLIVFNLSIGLRLMKRFLCFHHCAK